MTEQAIIGLVSCGITLLMIVGLVGFVGYLAYRDRNNLT